MPSKDIKITEPVEKPLKGNAQPPKSTGKSQSTINGEQNKPSLIDNRGGTISKSPIISGEKADVKIEYNDKEQ